MKESDQVFLYLAFAFAVKLTASAMSKKRRPASAECVGKIERLVFYPGKSFAPIDLQTAFCKKDGLHHSSHFAYDRCAFC